MDISSLGVRESYGDRATLSPVIRLWAQIGNNHGVDLMTYVYCLRNLVNAKVYVGFSSNPEKRWARERDGAHHPKNQHYSTILSRAIRKYGWDSFAKEILEECTDQASGLEAEKKWVRQLRSNEPDFGYNMDEGGGMPPNHTGKKRSEETLKRMSAGQKGKVISVEQRKLLSAAGMGRVLSEEAKAHLSAVNKGKTFTEATKEKISRAKKGVPLSEAHKAACSKARKRLVAAGGGVPPNKGVTGVARHSEETKAKMSAAQKGKPKSPEHVAKVVAANKAARQAKRDARKVDSGDPSSV